MDTVICLLCSMLIVVVVHGAELSMAVLFGAFRVVHTLQSHRVQCVDTNRYTLLVCVELILCSLRA